MFLATQLNTINMKESTVINSGNACINVYIDRILVKDTAS